MKLKSWSWKQYNRHRRSEAATEAHILGVNLSYQGLLIGGLTFLLLLSGLSPLYISLSIFLLIAAISLSMFFVFRSFPYLRKFYIGSALLSAITVAAHIIYLAK